MKSPLALTMILFLSVLSAWSQSPAPSMSGQSPDPSAVSAASDTSTSEVNEFLNPPAGVETRGDVSYLPEGRKEKMDLYLPKNRPAGTLSPAVLLIHGGGWTGGDKRQAREIEIGSTLAENGFIAASINYAMKSEGKYPLNLQDCKNGIRYLRAHAKELGIDQNKIAVLGGSAGGHLALMVGYTSGDASLAPTSPYPGFTDNVSAVIDMYGVTDIGNRKKTDKEGNPQQLREVEPQVKKIFGETESDWKRASPISYVRKDVPPTMILQGRKDTTVDRDQSQSLFEALTKAGAVTEIIYLDKAGHTFSFKYAATKAKKPLERDIGPEVITFLKKHLGIS